MGVAAARDDAEVASRRPGAPCVTQISCSHRGKASPAGFRKGARRSDAPGLHANTAIRCKSPGRKQPGRQYSGLVVGQGSAASAAPLTCSISMKSSSPRCQCRFHQRQDLFLLFEVEVTEQDGGIVVDSLPAWRCR